MAIKNEGTLQRNEAIDLLRVVGLTMIVLAHCAPPWYLFQLRNFDVPLMVLISGTTFSLSYRKEPYFGYIWKRVNRLIFPVWIFLTGLFTASALIDFPIPLPDIETLASSYLLLEGIGYVWIIRVFMLVALVAPAIITFHQRVKSNTTYLATIIGFYSFYEIIVSLTGTDATSSIGFIQNEILFYLIPYAAVFALGVRLTSLSPLALFGIASLSLILFFFHSTYLYLQTGEFVQTQTAKYPPTHYYLSYSLGISLILWILAPRFVSVSERFKMKALLLFISRNSIWFYLWHIIFVLSISLPSYLKFPIVLVLSGVLTWMQIVMVEASIENRIDSPTVKKNISRVLTG